MLLRYLSRSRLADTDDQGLLQRLVRDPNLDELAASDEQTVDETDHVLDNEGDTGPEEGPR